MVGKNKLWKPSDSNRVCSHHFIDGKPTTDNPDPTLHMGYEVNEPRKRKLPTVRSVLQHKLSRTVQIFSTETVLDDFEVQISDTDVIDYEEQVLSPEANDSLDVSETNICLQPVVNRDHEYCIGYSCSAQPTAETVTCDDVCTNCALKDTVIAKLQAEVKELEQQLKKNMCLSRSDCTDNPISITKNCCKGNQQLSHPTYSEVSRFHKQCESDFCLKFISSDIYVKQNTGLASVKLFHRLHNMIKAKAGRMRYWVGAKASVFYYKRYFKRSPLKPGRLRTLSTKHELLLVLMKLKLAVTNAFLACLFGISEARCSSILNTWIKLLSAQLRNLVIWPSKDVIQSVIPRVLKSKYPSLRCTIDCSETFIERPRDLYLQAATWSDYKHHNTLKYLIAIAPDGLISFISSSWGGRTTDRHIVQHSGFLDLIDPFDVILADRGFTIQEDLLFRHARLVIPPSSSGKMQMCSADVVKTKAIANSRIHVERAINRLKWFRIVKSTIPVTMIPLFDDILVICAALCNLMDPLVY
jgi:hypothetical protein